MNGPRFPGRMPPPQMGDGGEEIEGIIEPPRPQGMGMGAPMGRDPGLRVVGGQNSPVRRPDLLASIRHWHKGIRDRKTGEVQPWTTLVLTHLDSGRQIGQFDVRPDEDEVELAIEIESVMDSHGKPLSRNTGVTQNYQLDAYFGIRVDPQSNWVGDVAPSANLDGFGMGNGIMRSRGTPQDFAAQDFRRRELEISASFGLTRYNVELLVSQLQDARARIATLEAREDAIKLREQAAKAAEDAQELERMRTIAKIKRTNFVVAKLARYVPIIASRLDQKLFGLAQLTPAEKNAKTSEIVETLLKKLSDNKDGMEKMNTLINVLDLSEDEVQKIKDVGVMMWLEKQREGMQREAELAQKGGFAALGDDVKELMGEEFVPGRRQIGEGRK